MIKDSAIETLRIEADSVLKLIDHVDEEFVQAVQCILECKARVIITGMGKSGHVGRKIAASLASTGTPSFFMHPAEAFHGDLGMVTADDVVIAISNSGESTEVVNILPVVKRIGAKIIAMSGRRESALGRNADFFIDISVERRPVLWDWHLLPVPRQPWPWVMPLQWHCWRPETLPDRTLPCSIQVDPWDAVCF